ncbi:MAG: GDP-mannose 4,6-dehydratase [Chloroflexi bacterium]|nr:GDP-mannose 4,6-dehydratase [Chloroflexota bacterium]
MRALITGVGGFAGSHLSDYLLAHTDWQVFGCVLPGWDCSRLDRRVQCIELDLRDRLAVRAMLEQNAPSVIFHLAAQAFVPVSWQDPWDTLENNIRAQTNLLDGLVKLNMRPRMLIVGSNEEYGLVQPQDLPLNENSPLRTNNPYAVSKLTQDWLGLAYFLSHQIPIVRVRPFSHIGPRQADNFVVPAFAKQIAAIEAGQQEPVIRVGNLTARRDFTDVRDMVRAYHLAITQGEPGEVYNIGSSQSHSIQQVLEILMSFSRVSARVEQDPARMRPSDTPEIRCDASKFHRATGWQPTIPFEQSLRDVLDDWRGRLAD